MSHYAILERSKAFSCLNRHSSEGCIDNSMYKFAAASAHEPIIFGASRPGYREAQVSKWIAFMRGQEVRRVCCLLSAAQLARYTDLLDTYRSTFGVTQVCWAPVEDFSLVKSSVLLNKILPFLVAADSQSQKAVVHCSGGVGRTGQVLTAWLIAGRGFSKKLAIAAVKETGRNPFEAVVAAPLKGRFPWRVSEEFDRLLAECGRASSKAKQ